MSCGVCWGSSSYLGQFKVKTLLVMENGYPISAFTVQVLKRISIFVSGFAMYIITIVAKFFIFFLRKDSVTFFSMTRQHSIAGIFFWWGGGVKWLAKKMMRGLLLLLYVMVDSL